MRCALRVACRAGLGGLIGPLGPRIVPSADSALVLLLRSEESPAAASMLTPTPLECRQKSVHEKSIGDFGAGCRFGDLVVALLGDALFDGGLLGDTFPGDAWGV